MKFKLFEKNVEKTEPQEQLPTSYMSETAPESVQENLQQAFDLFMSLCDDESTNIDSLNQLADGIRFVDGHAFGNNVRLYPPEKTDSDKEKSNKPSQLCPKIHLNSGISLTPEFIEFVDEFKSRDIKVNYSVSTN